MSDQPRYAIYFVPAAETDLYGFGSGILGYDCYTGADIRRPPLNGREAEDWDAVTREPRTYGFHATLKAPFYLASHFDQERLLSRLETFAALDRPTPVVEPMVRALGSFVALVPREPCLALNRLADECVTFFDPFRAPLSAEDRKRRLAAGLDEGQLTNLDRWGYPYVFDDFRFHMSLTGPIPEERRELVIAAMRGAFARCCSPVAVDRITLVRQDRQGARFRAIRQVALGTRSTKVESGFASADLIGGCSVPI